MALDSLPFEVICLIAWSLPRTKDQLSLLRTSRRLHDTVIHAIYKQQSNYGLLGVLRWLLRTGFERGLQHLLSRNNSNGKINVEPGSILNHTPLLVAIRWGHLNIVELLLRNGARVNLGTYVPALECAAMLDKYYITNLLLRNGAQLEIVGQGSGLTALACAVKLGYTALNYNSPPRDHRWCNSSSYKAQSEFAAVIQLLLTHGADPNCKSILYRSTPMHQIPEGPWKSPEELLPLFLGFGALLDTPDWQGNTPLHTALRHRAFLRGAVAQKAWVRQLLKFGANVNAKNMHGDTPFGISFNDPSVLQLL
ncbi:hypothetical protein N7475_004902 [Penicillium sp. IBT 31633x]|nr:hypothetical protein N7475_004902 [Penicillium sp. IBT 31633x]